MGLFRGSGGWKLAAGAVSGAPAGGLAAPAATQARCISGYQPSQVPSITALAQQFAISDRTFSSGDSASWAGHMDIVAASADHFYGDNPVPAKTVTPGPGWGCDSDRVTFDYGQIPLKPVRRVHRPLPASAKRIRLTPALANDPT